MKTYDSYKDEFFTVTQEGADAVVKSTSPNHDTIVAEHGRIRAYLRIAGIDAGQLPPIKSFEERALPIKISSISTVQFQEAMVRGGVLWARVNEALSKFGMVLRQPTIAYSETSGSEALRVVVMNVSRVDAQAAEAAIAMLRRQGLSIKSGSKTGISFIQFDDPPKVLVEKLAAFSLPEFKPLPSGRPGRS